VISLYVALCTLTAATRERLSREETGATAVEYGLMVGLIAVAIIGTVLLLGGELDGLFQNVRDELPGG
jgi:pilus assembly protein Flp/PilA